MGAEAPLPQSAQEGRQAPRGRTRKAFGIGLVAGSLAVGLAVVGLRVADSGKAKPADCPRIPGVTIVTPDMITGQQGGWARYEGQRVCIQGIAPGSIQMDAEPGPVTEVTNPDNGTLLPTTLTPVTVHGENGGVVNLYEQPDMTALKQSGPIFARVLVTSGSEGNTTPVPVADAVGTES